MNGWHKDVRVHITITKHIHSGTSHWKASGGYIQQNYYNLQVNAPQDHYRLYEPTLVFVCSLPRSHTRREPSGHGTRRLPTHAGLGGHKYRTFTVCHDAFNVNTTELHLTGESVDYGCISVGLDTDGLGFCTGSCQCGFCLCLGVYLGRLCLGTCRGNDLIGICVCFGL